MFVRLVCYLAVVLLFLIAIAITPGIGMVIQAFNNAF